jgi:hypothetical protein
MITYSDRILTPIEQTVEIDHIMLSKHDLSAIEESASELNTRAFTKTFQVNPKVHLPYAA